MKQNHIYKINYEENQIIVTKSFLKEAGIIGSAAYTELVQIRKDFPDYRIVEREINKKNDKRTYGELTYKKMSEYIEAREGDNAKMVLDEFERVQQLSKIHSGPYAFVKNWFLNRYGDEFKNDDSTSETITINNY